MSLTVFALLAGLVAVASGSTVSVMPDTSEVGEEYIYPYTYITYYLHGKEYIYTYESCSSPPTSVEVCLTSIFASVEKYLTIIDKSLIYYESYIEYEMKYEHSLLTDEVSWVSKVHDIAISVKEAVLIDYKAEKEQVYELYYEKEEIEEIYEVLIKELDYLDIEIQDVVDYKKEIYQEYYAIYYAKWSVYYYISEIKYEKVIIEKEEVEIKEVVEVLYEQIEKIEVKISELNKRQDWLVSWEDKLSVDMSDFEKEVKRFKEVEVNLKKEEVLLYKEQERLLYEAEYVEEAIRKLKLEYVHIVSYLKELEIYEKEIYALDISISEDASVFISAYSDFTCQDSLLYEEACDSSHLLAAAPAAPAAGLAAPAAKP